MTPKVVVSIGGTPVSGVGKRALQGTVTESDGEKADQLQIEISNYDGRLKKPRTGETVTVQLGWQETGLVKVGQFTITGTVKTGPKATFHVTGDSADLKKTLKKQKSRSWKSPKKLGDVFEDIARDNQLQPAVDEEAAQTKIEKIIAQTGESDMHLAMRLGRHYGLLVKFQEGRLVVVKRGAGRTASGAAAGSATVTPNDCEGFSFIDRDRPARGKAKAIHYDRSKAKRNVEESESGRADMSLPDYVNPHAYGTQIEAKNLATSRKHKFDRDTRAFHVTLKPGSVGTGPGGVIQTNGFGDDDDTDWVVKRRHFGFSHDGLVVRLDCEPRQDQ